MKVHTMAQYSPLWWSVRRGKPTASEFGKIITPGGKLSEQRNGYAAELLGQFVEPGYGHEDSYVSSAMRNGTIMEPEARATYEAMIDAKVQQVGFCLDDTGRFGSSPDALIAEDGVLELKSPTAKTHILWLLGGELPAEHRPQCHGHLVVTGRQWVDFVSYFRGLPLLRVRVEPDAYTKKLRDCLDMFWEEYQGIRERIKVTPLTFDVPDEREMSQAEIDLGLLGGSPIRNTADVA